jgi:hypothetical protein
MLDKQRGNIIFECDGCADVLDPETRDFDAAIAHLRGENWRAVKVGDVWNHYCSGCKPCAG